MPGKNVGKFATPFGRARPGSGFGGGGLTVAFLAGGGGLTGIDLEDGLFTKATCEVVLWWGRPGQGSLS